MARAIGVSRRTYDRIKDGTRELTVSEAVRIARFTGQNVLFFSPSFDAEDEAVLTGDGALVNADNSELEEALA